MTETDATLDELLSRWFAWQRADRGVRGFNTKALVMGSTRAMRVQYEAQLEKQDDEHDALVCRQIDHEVSQMADPFRTSLHIEAKGISTGLDVWRSPRLPEDKYEREQIRLLARQMLVRRLVSAGVMDCPKDLLRRA